MRQTSAMRRLSAIVSVALVSTVAAFMSYSHQRHLAETNGQNALLSAMWPLAVDGLILATSVLVTADRADGYRARGWAVLGFWVGVSISVTANGLASDPDLLSRAISASPAIILLITVEALSTRPKSRKVKTPETGVETPSQSPQSPVVPPSTLETAVAETQTRVTPRPVSVSRMVSKDQRTADRLSLIKAEHEKLGKDWQVDRVTYADIETYTGLSGRQTVSDLSKALYPPTPQNSPLTQTGDI